MVLLLEVLASRTPWTGKRLFAGCFAGAVYRTTTDYTRLRNGKDVTHNLLIVYYNLQLCVENAQCANIV